jgi:CTP synthase
LDEQRKVTNMGGTMRLGTQPCILTQDSAAQIAYHTDTISERHRHRYEFNNVYRSQFEAHGMRFSGQSPDGNLVEILELPSQSFYLAVQFHPEFKSKPTKSHPLFAAFVGAAVQRRIGRKQRNTPPETTDRPEQSSLAN